MHDCCAIHLGLSFLTSGYRTCSLLVSRSNCMFILTALDAATHMQVRNLSAPHGGKQRG